MQTLMVREALSLPSGHPITTKGSRKRLICCSIWTPDCWALEPKKSSTCRSRTAGSCDEWFRN